MKKTLKIIFAVCWIAFCISGIVTNAHKYNFISWLIVISVSILPILVLVLTTKKKEELAKKEPLEEQVKEEATTPIEITKEDIYIEKGNMTYRADGKPISDEEVPYLVQIGMEKALRKQWEASHPNQEMTQQDEENIRRYASEKIHNVFEKIADG